PWLGTWNPVGSYFDQGDPNVGFPQNADGVRSPSYSGSDAVKNRVTVRATDMQVAGASYFYGIHLIHQGEAVANRGDNLASRGFNPQQSGSNWSFPNNSVGQVHGSILQHWPGSSLDVGQNGNDDGRFFVAVKVTTTGSVHHYEYAVHNADNSRGGASFRVPVDPAGVVSNFSFRDIDSNALNDWSASRVGNEVIFQAPAGNALEWNTIYNFGFDCNIAPSFGSVALDEARVGPGALSVLVSSEVPSGIPAARVNTIGSSAGCGTCDAAFYEVMGNNSFDLAGSGMTMTLNSGEYGIGAGTGTWATPAGTQLSLGDDSQVQITLPFSLPYPGGSTSTLWVCSNGFISVSNSNGTPYTPSSSQFLGFSPCWAALWHDINPASGGAVRYESTPTSARVTWDAVPYYGSSATATFQYQFEPSGTVHVLWQTVQTGGNDFLVGWTPGGGPTDPGNTDLSAALPAGFGLCATPFNGLALGASNRPILGTTINLDTTGIPAGSPFGVIMKSLQQYAPPLDLTSYGMPGCEGYPMNGVSQMFLPTGPSHSLPFAIPSNTAFTGLGIVVQSFTYSPPLTPLGVVSSNGIQLILGPL
ncbi:MAG: hypothetical protein KDC98_09415, partial [Planctomycetes bacterium]|nr:hypothetical protein [Planctomycetota bacterium]